MKRRCLILVSAIVFPALGCARGQSAPAAASAPPPPPPKEVEIDVAADPSHHLAVENQYLRALKVELAPNAATSKHRHTHDYVTVAFGSAELSNEVDGKEPVKIKLDDGQVRFTDGAGPAHLVRNVATTPFHNVTIELLQDETAVAKAQWEDGHPPPPLHGGSREVLFVKHGVRVSKLDLKPGGVLPKHELSDHCFVVAVTDVDLRDEKGGHSIDLHSGEVKWDDGGSSHKLTNKSKQAAKIVLLEFK
jgi:quercetin dioxygenase-like cupin family protein